MEQTNPPQLNAQDLEAMMRRQILKQTLWVWSFSMVAIRLLHELQRIRMLKDYTLVLTAAILIYLPVWVYHRRRETVSFFENSFNDLVKSLGWFLVISVAIFPILEVGDRYFQEIFFNARYVGGNYKGLLTFALFQLVLVAIPEEIFYRGYVQPQLNRVWGRPWKFLGASFGKSLIFTSFLFAFSHSLIQLKWWHFSIFFPSLVFAWLRERTGAVTAGALFHTLSNTYSYWAAHNYR
jgi:membrane protease YdiL (CAAX protease family)